jgi:hypothetical protein
MERDRARKHEVITMSVCGLVQLSLNTARVFSTRCERDDRKSGNL